MKDSIYNKIKNFFTKNEITAAIITIIVGFINNFNFFLNEGVAPDTISTHFFHIASEWEFSLGRYGIGLLDNLRGGLVNKFLIVTICLFFLALSVAFLIKTFKFKNKMIIYLIAVIIGVAPQFTETYMFIYCADSYCFAILLSVLAVYFLDKTEMKKINYIWAIICIALSCTLYQAYLGVSGGLIILLIIKYLLDGKKIDYCIKKVFIFVLTFGIGVIIYYLITNLLLSVIGLRLASYKGANALGIETIKYIPKGIYQCYKDLFNFLFKNNIINNSVWKRDNINIIFVILMIINILILFIRNNKEKLRYAFIVVLLLLLPVFINVMDIIAKYTTINLVTGAGILNIFVMFILFIDMLEVNKTDYCIKYISYIILVMLSFTFVLGNNATYMSRKDTFNNYYTVSNNIYNRVTMLDGYNSEQKWLFNNVIEYESVYAEKANGFISDDNVTWKNYGGILQNKYFYKKYLGIDIELCSEHEYMAITNSDKFKKMPVYPNDGSIKIIDNVIVVKISENSFDLTRQ